MVAEDKLRTKVKFALEDQDLSRISALTENQASLIKVLVRFSYDKDTLVGWRAIKAMGVIAREMVRTDPQFLRETCRKLLWSLSDESGGIGWSAPELLGEIVASDPALFRDLVPLIVSAFTVEERTFRPGVLYALGRIAEQAPDAAAEHREVVLLGLSDPDPLCRLFAIQTAARILPLLDAPDREALRSALRQLAHDRSEAWIYEGDGFSNKVVDEEAAKLLARIG